ncbi:pilus motility taxis protein HmpF [Limnoraphis robusta Tam1]|uniref:pilus motility taxis protein HmpF n=1 Tax=Limnoraphis robusta TaxID=1118279 RepID=UPI002B1EBE3B|nr:pilus motility taxis protein HmpF [Limnoraphis robusta]MEA5496705.1 pilus motility taxis protein HmpF [Limnoraphis robusta BA-68 BA1]MEA5541614.1 pilus motility taxis protein HmpF [Limnoraphis robusta Tam1]
MLYLAEVQKQRSFGLGGGRAELKLLACQRGENNWTAVTGDEVIPAEDANNFKDGALVLVDLNSSKHVQRIQDAARQLVSILQDFSRLQEKFKTQQEEIEQWKESLTYQSQELNRREMEMEAQREQLEQLEEEFERLEQQRQEIESARQQGERLRSELDQSQAEIEQTRQQLQQQIRQLEDQQAGLKSAPALSQEQSQQLQSLLAQLSTPVALDALQRQLEQATDRLEAGQSTLQHHWQQLQEKQTSAEQLQDQVDATRQSLQTQWQNWYESQDDLTQLKSNLQGEYTQLTAKQELAETWQTQLQNRQTLLSQLEKLAAQFDETQSVGVVINVSALEAMPIEKLKEEVDKLQQEWDRWFRMVKEQEDELKYKREDIEQLQQQLVQASDGERSRLESELTDENDAYDMLNRTIGGQRRTLREREAILIQHQAVLLKRQGLPANVNPDGLVNFERVLSSLNAQHQDQQQKLEVLEAEISQIQTAIQQLEETVNRQTDEQQQKRQQLEAEEHSWREQYQAVSQLWGTVSLYQQMLQPLQNNWNELKQQVETTTTELNQLEHTRQQQSQKIEQLQQIVSHLT